MMFVRNLNCMIFRVVPGLSGAIRPGLALSLGLLLIGQTALVSAAWLPPVANSGDVSNGEYAEQWSVENSSVLAQAVAVKMDEQGDIYSLGNLDQGDATENNIVLSKHDVQGNLLWQQVYDSGSDDVAVAFALDAAGNVFVAGQSLIMHAGDTASNYDFIILKFDSAGSLSQVFSSVESLPGYHDEVVAMAVHTNGAVFVTGRSYHPDGQQQANSDILTVRFAGTGNVVWSDRYDGNGGKDEAVGLVLENGTNNFYVGGTSAQDFITIKYAANGRVNDSIWPRRYDSGTNDAAKAIIMDGQDNIYIIGSTWASSGFPNGTRNFLTLKYDNAGVEQWSSIYSANDGEPRSIAVDSAGDVLVAGRERGNTDHDIRIVKYAGVDGGQQWVTALYDGGGDQDDVTALALDVNDNIYLAGAGGSMSVRDYLLLRYDAGGGLIDTLIHDGSQNETLSDMVLGADDEGKTYALVIGDNSSSIGLTQHYSVVKFGMMRPDLKVDGIVGPARAISTGLLNVTVTLSNIKDSFAGKMATAMSFDLALYVTQQPGNPLADLFPLPPVSIVAQLSSGASTVVDISVPVPASVDLAEGTYYLVARADDAAAVIERDEDNNLLVSGVSMVVFDPPELVPTAVTSSLPAAPAASDIDISYSIDNLRAPDAGSFDVGFVLSPDAVVGNGDDITLPLVSGGTVSVLTGNNTANEVATVHIPNTVVAGDYYLGVIVDTGNVIDEPDETNNTLIGSSQLTVEPIVDLIVSDVSSVPLAAVLSDTIVVSNTVQANLNDATVGFDVGVYLSLDSAIETTDRLLGARTVASLNNGSSNIDTAQPVTIPADVVPGLYYLGVVVDIANTVTESDETNNGLASAATIVIGDGSLPDLLISELSGPTSVARGVEFTVTPTVQNVMPATINVVNEFNVGIYLSPDNIITTSDYWLADGVIPGLVGNGVDSSPIAVTIPLIDEQAVVWSQLGPGNTFDSTTNTLVDVSGGWALSEQQVEADGWIEWAAGNKQVSSLGLSLSTANAPRNVEYAINLLANGRFNVYVFGVKSDMVAGFYAAGDTFRVERQGQTILFVHNGVLFYSYISSVTGGLSPSAAFAGTGGATIVDAQVVNVPVATGDYYLGAIVDNNNVVVEVSDANNSAIQTDVNGNLEATTVSVHANVSGTRAGGGASGLIEAGMLLLSWLLLMISRTPLSVFDKRPM